MAHNFPANNFGRFKAELKQNRKLKQILSRFKQSPEILSRDSNDLSKYICVIHICDDTYDT